MSNDAADPSAARRPLALANLTEPGAVLFDLDGTLVDTVATRIRAWIDALAEHGLTPDRELLASYIGSDGRWLAREIARVAGRVMDWEESDQVDRLSGELYDGYNRNPAPLPGAHDLLSALEASPLAWCVATSSQPGQVQVSIDSLKLPAQPPITDGSHVAHAKPEPDLLLAAAAALKVAPGRCWYVGDSTWDMMASVRAGMTGLGITTGASNAAKLRDAGATVTVASLNEVLVDLRRRGLLG